MFSPRVLRRLLTVACLLAAAPISLRAEPATALFAGGCFWCMEADFQGRAGVIDVVSGFSAGELPNPTYKGDHSGHWETIQITYDPDKVSYAELLSAFWPNVDPFDAGGQFCDRGDSYRAAIFVANAAQRELAEAAKAEVAARFPELRIVTEIREATQFWPVEDYHQDYSLKNPVRYKYYRWRCGRDQRLQAIWGSEAEE